MRSDFFAARIRHAPIAISLLAGSYTLAEQGSAVLIGTVVDASTLQPVAAAVVVASSPNLQGERSGGTDNFGMYRISQLPPGTYSIRCRGNRYKQSVIAEVSLSIDQTIRLNIELVPEYSYTEELLVTARPPTLDIESGATGLNIGSDFVRNLPLVSPGSKGSAYRSFESLAEVVPGSFPDRYGVSINGTTSPENSFVVDGLSLNDPAYGVLGTPLTVEFIEQVNVISGGYMPEYGRTTGATLNAVTKSGSNEFRGSIFGSYAPGALSFPAKEIRQASVFSGVNRLWNQGNVGAELGGPLLRDKLWFYTGVVPSESRFRNERNLNYFLFDSNGVPLLDGETGIQKTARIPGTRTFTFIDQTSIQYIGKLTYAPTEDQRLILSVYGAPSVSGGIGKLGIEPLSGTPETTLLEGSRQALAHRYTNQSNDVSLHWSSAWMEKKVLLDVTAGWHHQYASIRPEDNSPLGSSDGLSGAPLVAFRRSMKHSILDFENIDAPMCEPSGSNNAIVCPVTNYRAGGPGAIHDSKLDRYQGRAVATYLYQWLGHHATRAGLELEFLRYQNDKAYTGTVFYRESSDGRFFSDVRQFGFLTGPDQPVIQLHQLDVTTSQSYGLFVQDSWSLFDLVTLNAGVRFDSQFIYGSDGKLGLALPDEWSPRVGAVWDFTRNGRSKLYANYARYYESIPLDMADRSFPGERRVLATHFASSCNPLDPAQSLPGGACRLSTNLVPKGDPADPNHYWTVSGGDRKPVDPNIEPQSSDEIVVGGEYELLRQGRLGVYYVRRYMNEIIEDMSNDEAQTYFLGNPGRGLGRAFPKATRNYDAVTVYFTKTFSQFWLAQASYTWSYLRGNWSGLYRPETGQLDPNITSDFDLLSLMPNRQGRLPNDSTHQIKVFGAREFVVSASISLNLGMTYRGRSGEPENVLGSHPIYGPGEAFILPRGIAGNLPWVHTFDGHVGVSWRLSDHNALIVSTDVFNLFNSQTVTRRDTNYTFSDVRPIPGGTMADLPANVRHLDGSPLATAEINPNWRNPVEYQAPRTVRLAARVTF